MKLGVDLGGTKTEVILLTNENNTIFRKRIPTQRETYDDILSGILSLVKEADNKAGCLLPVGVGIPGTVDNQTSTIKNANLTLLIGKPLQNDLRKLLGRPVRTANDANCFALSEALDGAGKGYGTVFGVIVGTGCGGGIIINGKVHVGANAIAGEWGHNTLPAQKAEEMPGPACYCGRNGCIETFISGTGFEQAYQKITNRRLKADDIISLASAGDKTADAIVAGLEDRMARALASVINVIDPHCIVLGGGLSNIDRLYQNIPKIWGKYIFNPGDINTLLLKPQHGDSSGVRGAAWLWNDLSRPANENELS